MEEYLSDLFGTDNTYSISYHNNKYMSCVATITAKSEKQAIELFRLTISPFGYIESIKS